MIKLPDHESQPMREYLMAQRQAKLLEVESIEILLGISPRTSEIRKAAKDLLPFAKFTVMEVEGSEKV